MERCLHGTVNSHCTTFCLVQDGRASQWEDPASQASLSSDASITSSAAVVIDLSDDSQMSSSHSYSQDEDEYVMLPTPPEFTRVGGSPDCGECSARTNLSYIHPLNAKYLKRAAISPEEKVGLGSGEVRKGARVGIN